MKATKKNKEQAHIIALFGAMINRLPIIVDHTLNDNLYIQRINLDGECDIYSSDYKEVIMEDVCFSRIRVKN